MKKIKGVFCPECGYEGYEVDEYVVESKGDNGTFKYLWQDPYCPKCEKLLWIDEIHDANIDRARDADRKAWGRVSYEELLMLPRRYGVPREMLNIILDLDNYGPGVIFTSLWRGGVAGPEESDRIRDAQDPKKFLKYLEAAEDKISKEKYKKIHKRVTSMIHD